MVEDFVKFPRTSHVPHSYRRDRDDKYAAEDQLDMLFQSEVTVQEKLDGSNVGFSFNADAEPFVQNRGSMVDFTSPHFKKLQEWYQEHENELFDVCLDRYIIFGEWLFWRHTVPYSALPTYYMICDIYDKKEVTYLSQTRIKTLLQDSSLIQKPCTLMQIPVIYQGRISALDEITSLVTTSLYGRHKAEGVYLRVDADDVNIARMKYVTTSFRDRIRGHWKNNALLPNKSVNPSELLWAY